MALTPLAGAATRAATVAGAVAGRLRTEDLVRQSLLSPGAISVTFTIQVIAACFRYLLRQWG